MVEKRIESKVNLSQSESLESQLRVPLDSRGRVLWSSMTDEEKIQYIEYEAVNLAENGIALSPHSLSGQGKSGLDSAITRHYPGKYTALRENLGITFRRAKRIIANTELNESYANIIGPSIRDARGNLVWNIASYSEDQNLKMGITNMQHLLITAIPEFGKYILKLAGNNVEDEDKEEIKRIILNSCGEYDAFVSLLSGAPLNRNNAPYFLGSHAEALRKTLSPLGINFKFRDFKVPANFWKDKSQEEVISIMQQAFLEEHLDFAEQYIDPVSNMIYEDYRDMAKQYVIESIANKESLEELYGGLLDKRKSPHFDGLKSIAISELLSSWGINTKIRDFRLDRGMWRGKTLDECVEVMQQIWLETFPEFDEMFPRNDIGEVDDVMKREATEYILERAGAIKRFTDVFSGSPTVKNVVPVFSGSYIQALRFTFKPWGIHFKIRDFKRERVWLDKTRDEVIQTARVILLEEFPEFESVLNSYKKEPSVDLASQIRDFIQRNFGSQKKFNSIFGGVASYLRCPYRDVLRDIFSNWEINIESDPRSRDAGLKGVLSSSEANLHEIYNSGNVDQNIKNILAELREDK